VTAPSSQLPTLRDGAILIRLLARSARVLDLADYIHAVDDLAEDDVLVVEEGRRYRGDEELAAVGVGAGILRGLLVVFFANEVVEKGDAEGAYGHAEQTGGVVLEVEILVCEGAHAVDGC